MNTETRTEVVKPIDIDLPEVKLPAPSVISSDIQDVKQPSDLMAMLSMIERLARDPQVIVEKQERLVKLYSELLERQAEEKFNIALRDAQMAMPAIQKTGKNKDTHSSFPKLDKLSKAVDPIIYANGFSLSYGTADSPLPNHYRVTCSLSHTAGYKRNYFIDVPSDMVGPKGNANKTPTHGMGSAMTYGRRYLKVMIFDLRLSDDADDDDGNGSHGSHDTASQINDDGNAAGDGKISEKQLKELQAFIVKNNASIAKICKFAQVPRLEEIASRGYTKLMRDLTVWANQQTRTAKKPQARR